MAVQGVSKYGDGVRLTRLYKPGLPEEVSKDLEQVANHALAKGTWSSYRTALKMLEQCCRARRMELVWPVSEDMILIFVHWLLVVKQVSASTVQTYLSGIRAAHIMQGWPTPTIRTDLINMGINPNKAGLFQKEPRNLKSFTAQKGLK